jgi:Spy/CpxP family protein refolding chaperone
MGDSHRGPMDRAMHVGPPGRWWDDRAMAQRIGLSQAQQRKMDEVFQQSRPQLIDLNAALQKQEALLEPMLAADAIDDDKVLAQIDRVIQSRAALERANSVMLLGLRKALTTEQWRQLQAEDPRNR